MTSYPQFPGAPPPRPSVMGSAGQHQNFGPPTPMQFRPVGSSQQAYQFTPGTSQQFQSVGQGAGSPMIGVPLGQSQMPHYNLPTQQLLQGSGQASQVPPSLQAVPMPYVQPNRPISCDSVQLSQNTHETTLGSVGRPLPMSFTYTTSNGQQPTSMHASSQYQSMPQVQAHITPAQGQPWSTSAVECAHVIRPLVQASQQSSVAAKPVTTTNTEPKPVFSSDWIEHTSPDGRRYYHNKKTKQSTWEKPLELLTPIERADASTDWKEYSTPEGRKYYYNKVTKQSKWTIPDELKMAREQAEKAGTQSGQTQGNLSVVSVSVSLPPVELPPPNNFSQTMVSVAESSMNSVTLDASSNPHNAVVSESSSVPIAPTEISSSSLETSNGVCKPIVKALVSPSPVTASPASVPASFGTDADIGDLAVIVAKDNHDTPPLLSCKTGPDEAFTENLEEDNRGTPSAGKTNIVTLEEKSVVEEPVVYANKLDAKIAFKALLESANIGSDWNWDQTMRVIINDKRYSALKTLGERKQSFNEYLSQRKKQEVEERRNKQKKAREDFTRMLEDCKELTSSTRWSKAVFMFENDERFNAVERVRDREDIFETYLMELEKKERSKAAEEHKLNILEYRAFLESCDFIKANSQWRKVHDRLEDDERCSRLEKYDRLRIFQDYITDLEKEGEEQKKIEKEQLRKKERKNRDEFRKLMQGHVSDGILTAKTNWRDYLTKVKDLPSCVAVSANTSGQTPKDLFEDVAEELQKQYHEDKARIKDALKIRKIDLGPAMSFVDFKVATMKDDSLRQISETNLKFAFDELLERLREREEKEAKKRQRLADNFYNLLNSVKEITASSTWEECKFLVEDCPEYISIEESYGRGIFEDYVAQLQERVNEERRSEEEKAKKQKEEKEKRRKERKEKEKQREKEEGRHRKGETERESSDELKEKKRRDKDRERKHRKHDYSRSDDVSSEKDEKKATKRSHGHHNDSKKSRKHASTESESESRHKRHKKDRHISQRIGPLEGFEDDGEMR